MSDNTAGVTPTNPQADGVTPETPVTTPNGATPDGNAAQPETVESLPEWAQKLVRDLRKENEKRRQQADAERTQAEEKRLADEKRWQELAEQRARERDELKPYREKYEALAAQRKVELVAETAKWPAEVKALLPGEDADVTALCDAIVKARPLVKALEGKADAAAGQGVTPRPAGVGGVDQAAARAANKAAFYRDL